MTSPCKCKGTMAYVHPDCLAEWTYASGNAYSCETCRGAYDMYAGLSTWEITKRNVIWGLWTALDVAVGLLVLLIYMAMHGELSRRHPSLNGKYDYAKANGFMLFYLAARRCGLKTTFRFLVWSFVQINILNAFDFANDALKTYMSEEIARALCVFMFAIVEAVVPIPRIR